jgi:hypothetical protein
MNNRIIMVVLLVGTAAVLMPGCIQDREKTATEVSEDTLRLLLESSLAEISGLQEAEGDAAAVARMRQMLSQPAYLPVRFPIFLRLLDTLQATGDADGVLAAYLEFGVRDAGMAEGGFRQAIQAAMQDEDPQVRADRLERLIAAGALPLPVRVAAWQYRIEVYAQSGSIADFAARVVEFMDSDAASAARTVFSTAISQGMRIGDYTGVKLLLATIETRSLWNADLDLFVKMARGELLLAQDKPEAAWNHFVALADVIGDNEYSRRIPAVLNVAKRLERQKLVQRVVDAAYQSGDQFPVTRDVAAAWAVGEAADSGKVGVLLAATGAALDSGAAVARFYHVFARGLYAMIQTATPDERIAMGELLRRLSEVPGLTEALLGMIASARLDVAFFAGDFKAALVLIEAGVPGFDEAWHEEHRDKVSAHIAQQEGRLEDAVALYRKHIARVSAWANPMINPENNRHMTKEVVIAFNEKRIGDIWSAVPGREAEAAAAYASAREWYGKGLELLAPDSPEYAEAATELAAVPKAE